MTTHYVDIRLKALGLAAPWEALTESPIPLKDAKGLLACIGDKWEARLRAVSVADDVATMLERLNVLVDVPEGMAAEARAVSGGGNASALWFKQHEDVILTLLRSGVFGVFERYRGELGLDRWRPTNNVPKHKQGCKKSKVTAVVTAEGRREVAFVFGADPLRRSQEAWKILTEIDARAQHINAATLPGLGIAAAFVVHPPKFHTATCKTCGAESHAFTIACEVIWGDHHMTREYEI